MERGERRLGRGRRKGERRADRRESSRERRGWRRGEKNEAHSHFDQGNQCDCVGQ